MRKTILSMTAMLVLAASAPRAAYALTRNDTMLDWLHASDADRTRVLDDLQGNSPKPHQASRAEIKSCMDGAAGVAGHGALQIGDVAEACSEPPSPDGKAATDI